MIAVDFRDQAAHVERIAADLVGQHPSCWNVVLPPGFGEERFVEQLAKCLRNRAEPSRLAVRGADQTNKNIVSFVQALHAQWADLPDWPRPLHKQADIYLDRVLSLLRDDPRPLILILKRFHRVLDSLDEWVLGVLHEEEEARRLHTVTITPLPYEHLKKRWKSRNHFFCNSLYGSARHKSFIPECSTIEEVLPLAESLNIGTHVAEYAHRLTGGCAEPLGAILEWWVNMNRPQQFTPAIREEMLRLAGDQLARFVKWLDPVEDGTYRDHVIDLYHGINTDQAREAFYIHPWRDIVLDEEWLRAEALGAAALNAALRDPCANGKTSHSPWYEVREHARRLYERGQYVTAEHVLEMLRVHRLRPHDRILQAHAAIMVELSGRRGNELFGGHINCPQLRHAIHEAREALATTPQEMLPGDRQKIEGRYRQLEGVVAAIGTAGSVTGRFQSRIADVLAGFAGEQHKNVQIAALALLVQAEAGKRISGLGTACQFVLALPEQIFRIWALWALGLNYYDAPAVDEFVWKTVANEWPQVHGRLQRAAPGQEFPNFYVFTFYAIACFQALPLEKQVATPEAGFKDLQRALSAFEPVRTGCAHGFYLPSKRQKQAYFELIDRWLTSLLAVCPNSVTREELLEIAEPLPLVNLDGTVTW